MPKKSFTTFNVSAVFWASSSLAFCKQQSQVADLLLVQNIPIARVYRSIQNNRLDLYAGFGIHPYTAFMPRPVKRVPLVSGIFIICSASRVVIKGNLRRTLLARYNHYGGHNGLFNLSFNRQSFFLNPCFVWRGGREAPGVHKFDYNLSSPCFWGD